MKSLLKPSLNWLLVFVPSAVYLQTREESLQTWTFIAACLAVIPLAGWMGRATEHLAERTSEGIGGLLNATFGNAAELIIAFMAMRQGLTDIVKASLTGSIIGNVLLVLGAALFFGGMKNKEQVFNAVGARMQSTLMTIAAVGLVAPAAFHHSVDPGSFKNEVPLSLIISIILLLTYLMGLWFSLRTHKHLFSGHGHSTEDNVIGERRHVGPGVWPMSVSIIVLVVATGLVAWISEILVHTVEHAGHAMGMNSVFIGVVVVAIIGNAAEHSTAVLMALKNRMDLSLGIAIGSSIQVALFVAPVLVILSHFFAPTPLDLVFTLPEVIAVVLAIAVSSQISGDGRSNWLEGALLLAVYAVLGVVFYYLPEGAASH
ncbi:MAG: calcium/proton exchanger [Verrucomicrobiales bacterium]|nr:calcium/proton exchanger [Verrucomicrobiales bacterium]